VKESHGFRIEKVQSLATYSFLGVESRTVRTPNGDDVERIIVTHPGAVAIVPMINADIVLIEQYRASIDRVILEIPAGKLDASDVSMEAAAHRELLEETGFVTEGFTRLTSIWPTVGFSDENITIFLAEDLMPGTAAPEGAEELAAVVKRFPFSQAVEMVVRGEITDSKTIAGIMIADAHRRTP
jgi:ADP-ribose pyrophosphatase